MHGLKSEVMKVEEKEKEIRVGESRIYIGEDGIVYNIAVGASDKKRATDIKEGVLELANMAEGKVNLLVDLNKAGRPSPEARKIYLEVAEHEKIRKVAMIGVHPVARVLASFLTSVSKKREMSFFKTKEEALAWLKE